MATTARFPRTNQELAELGAGQVVRFPGTEEEYWANGWKVSSLSLKTAFQWVEKQ